MATGTTAPMPRARIRASAARTSRTRKSARGRKQKTCSTRSKARSGASRRVRTAAMASSNCLPRERTGSMRAHLNGLTLALLLAVALPGFAATLTTQIDPPVINAGETSTLTVTRGRWRRGQSPFAAGRRAAGSAGPESVRPPTPSPRACSSRPTARKYQLSASQPGDYTISPFDITLKGGTTLRSP